MKGRGNSTEERLVDALERVLHANGFATRRELRLYETRFDIVAEDEGRLVFVSVRTNNDGWLDDFHDEQAALGAAASEVRLGRKWRDVYLIEVTTDPLDTRIEGEIAQEIRGNTLAARKLVIDAGSVDPTDEAAVEDLVSGFILRPRVDMIYSDMNVLGGLRDFLVEDGFDDGLVSGLIESSMMDGHDCVQMVIANITDETDDD